MKKLFWVAIGIGVGVLATRKIAEAADGSALNRKVARSVDRWMETADAFREGMREREEELRTVLATDAAK